MLEGNGFPKFQEKWLQIGSCHKALRWSPGSKPLAEASLDRDRAQREAHGEENEPGRIRRKERKVHIIQHTQPAASAPWVRLGHTADFCRLPVQAQVGTSRNSTCCCLGLVTATCSTTGTLHPEWSWAGSSDLSQIVGSSARGSLMPKPISAFPELLR